MKDLEEKLGIFICAHKDFIPQVSNETGCYRVAFAHDAPREIEGFKTYNCKPNIQNGLDDKFYSELYMMRYLADNVELPQWVGICHYRRYWRISSPEIIADAIDNNHVDLFVRKEMKLLYDNRTQYNMAHNAEDLDIVGHIIEEKFPEYKPSFDEFIKTNSFFPFNMFIMKREDFVELVNFQFAVLDEYLKIVGTDIAKRIEDNKEKYLKDFSPNNTADYQYRIGGYLGERLTNVFIRRHFGRKFKTIGKMNVDVTEEKYGLKF